MRLPTFIRLENSLDKALNYYNSPQMKHLSFAGVHLLPNHPFPYIQRTYATEGIELESWEHVYVNDLCGNRLEDIYNYFSVTDNFNDPQTGLPQILWAIINCPFDFGYRPVYLEIISGANAPIYSSVFYFTKQRGEFTSRWDYKDKAGDTMLSTGLEVYYRQSRNAKEVSTYTSISNNRSFNPSVKITPYELWKSNVVDNLVLLEFDRIFLCKYRYSQQTGNDVLPVRTGLYEADDTPDFEADENFAESQYSLTRDYSLTFNPNSTPIIPPPPPPDPPTITITRVLPTNRAEGAAIYFTTANYVSLPNEFIYQYSLDQVSWTNTAGVPVSPQTITVGNNTHPYYYRIWDYTTGIYSNEVQIAQPSITLNAITSSQSEFNAEGNNYQAFFTANNFTPTESFVFEVSTNNVNWVTAGTNPGTTSPRPVVTPVNGTEFTYFRMKYNPLGLISNVKQFNF